MDTALLSLVKKYEAVAEALFPRVAAHVGMDLPVTNLEWVLNSKASKGTTKEGIRYSKHGYGLIMFDGVQWIDMDLGVEGEMNGFDAHALMQFATENQIDTPFMSDTPIESWEKIQAAIDDAIRKGTVIYSGGELYYRKREGAENNSAIA